ncbi:hypothetical protein [Treponema endosymbiont of Eucomonympha sp.]|uniref:hypothetical protein n=1 Tax=Treponema endosymbiont of Eucomonympha sp. TaxID=1580831 RepID=UPI00359FADE6
MQSSPLPSSPPFMSGVCSSTFKSTLPSLTRGARVSGEAETPSPPCSLRFPVLPYNRQEQLCFRL